MAGVVVSIDCIHADVAHWLYVIGFVLMVACFRGGFGAVVETADIGSST